MIVAKDFISTAYPPTLQITLIDALLTNSIDFQDRLTFADRSLFVCLSYSYNETPYVFHAMPLLGIYRPIHHPTFPLTARVWVRQVSPPA